MDNVFSVHKPAAPLPLIFDSPHSGDIYPADFGYACDFQTLRQAEDHLVDELFAEVPSCGGALLLAHFPRSYIDPNRSETDIDPVLLQEPWPYGDISPTIRSDAGIGLIRRLVKPGIPVYNRTLSAAEIHNRILNYHRPYHKRLQDLIDTAHYNFGQVWHINCHSMPDATAIPKTPLGIFDNRSKSVDFCLGDLDGRSCDLHFTRALRDFLQDLGYTVTLNDPFKGVELVRRHASPARGRHSLQLEINKSLYMDEETLEKNGNFEKLQSDIKSLVQFCADYVHANLKDLAAD